MNREKKHTGGGTPKGERKPQKMRKYAKAGIPEVSIPTFADVGRACARFIPDRVARGEMRDFPMEEQMRAEARRAAEGRGE